MDVRKLKVYQKAFDLATAIYDSSKQFPKEEMYALTDQLRKSSREVCVAVSEGYRRREDEPYFVDLISTAEKYNGETQVWLDFVRDSGYLGKTTQRDPGDDAAADHRATLGLDAAQLRRGDRPVVGRANPARALALADVTLVDGFTNMVRSEFRVC